MVGWHHWLNGHEQALGDDERQGSLTCCSPWGCKESNTSEQQLNNNNGAGEHTDNVSLDGLHWVCSPQQYRMWRDVSVYFLLLRGYKIGGTQRCGVSQKKKYEASCSLVLCNGSFGPEDSPGIKTLNWSVLNKSITWFFKKNFPYILT